MIGAADEPTDPRCFRRWVAPASLMMAQVGQAQEEPCMDAIRFREAKERRDKAEVEAEAAKAEAEA